MGFLKKLLLPPFCIAMSAFFAFTSIAQQEDPQVGDKVKELQEQWRQIMKNEYNPSAIEPKTNGGPSFKSDPHWMRSSKKKARVHSRSSKKGAGGKMSRNSSSKSKLVSGKGGSRARVASAKSERAGKAGKKTRGSKSGIAKKSYSSETKARPAAGRSSGGTVKGSQFPTHSSKVGGSKISAKTAGSPKGRTSKKSSKNTSIKKIK